MIETIAADKTLRIISEAFIGGCWHKVGKTFKVMSPTLEKELAEAADCGPTEARLAADHAVRAFDSWSRASAFERSKIMMRWSELIEAAAEELAQLTTLEMGKTIRESRGEAVSAAGMVAWCAEEAKRVYGEIIPSQQASKQLLVMKQAIGPVFGITPWNFPLAMITRKVAPALAAGCSFILKPAEQTPFTALLLAKLWEEAGGPEGTFQVLPTNRPKEVSEVLLGDVRIRKLTFTGSTEVGSSLYESAARTLKRVSLELGGHAPSIVFEDADLSAAAQDVVATKYRNAGQTCISTNRLYVHSSVRSEFAEILAAEVGSLKVGNPLSEETDIGPMVNSQGLKKVRSHVDDAVTKGATVLVGGEGNDYYYRPTVLLDARPEMLILSRETFGPVVPIIAFDTDEEVIQLANATRYGLAAYFWTRDLDRAFKVSQALDYGIIGVNDGRPVQTQAPFGGMKDSGIGREGGKWGIEEYLETKFVSLGIGR